MSLNLKEACIALSYDIPVRYLDEKEGIWYTTQISEIRKGYCTLKEGFDVEFYELNLVLRPVSDVVKEITVDGNTFVPALLIAERIHQAGINFKISDPRRTDFKDYTYVEFEVKEPVDHSLRFLGYEKYNRSSFPFHKPEFLGYNIWDQMVSWHFDWNDLIKRRKAISIHDLKES